MSDEPRRQMTSETGGETSAPCGRCGNLTSERLVLRTGPQTTRASLWLCPECHQPQHRAAEEPARPDSDGTATR